MVDGQELELRRVVLERVQNESQLERFYQRTGHIWESSLVGHKWQWGRRVWHQLAVQIATSESVTWDVDIWQVECVYSSVCAHLGLIKEVIRAHSNEMSTFTC